MQLEKITKVQQSEEKKRFDDACGLAHAMELLGERWAMLVLRELAYGPRRFSELKADLQGISANVLTQRLNELEARGLVRKTRLPPPASVQVYESTPWGLEAIPVPAQDQYVAQVEDFCASIKAGRLLAPAEDGVANMRVLEAALKDAKRRRGG